jgi:hypothetical protein
MGLNIYVYDSATLLYTNVSPVSTGFGIRKSEIRGEEKKFRPSADREPVVIRQQYRLTDCAEILQGTNELRPATTEKLLFPVAILVKTVVSSVEPRLCFKESKGFTGKQNVFKYAVIIAFVAVLCTALE